MFFAALLACIRPLPPGPSPAEQSAESPTPVEIAQGGDRVQLVAVLRAGSAHDPVGSEGMAWLTAEGIRHGGSAQRPAAVLEAELAALGASLSVEVSRELVIFRAEAPADQAATLASRMGELIARPAFDPETLGELRDRAALTLVSGLGDDPPALADEALDTWLNQGHPYGHPIWGRAGVVERISAEDVRAWHTSHYTRQAAAIGLVGPADVIGPAGQAMAEAFSQLPETPYIPYLAIRAGATQGRSLLAIDGPPGDAVIRLGLALDVGPGDPDWEAVSLASVALGARPGDGPAVTWAGPTAAPSLSAAARPQGQLTIRLEAMPADQAPFALRDILRRVEGWTADGVDQAQVDSMQRAILSGLSGLDPESQLELQLAAAATGLPPLSRRWLEGDEALDAQAISRALAAHVDPDQLRVVVVIDQASAFVDALLEETESPAVYSGELPDTDRIDRDARTAEWPLALSPDRAFVTEARGLFR